VKEPSRNSREQTVVSDATGQSIAGFRTEGGKGASRLYNDRQLVVQQKLTKYFMPFDSVVPDGSWRLFIFDDPRGDRTVVLDEEATLIGRESFTSIQLTHSTVSRQHCVIQFRLVRLNPTDPKPEVVPYIFDIGSRHGVLINGEPVQPSCFVELKPRDRITIGTTVSTVLMRTTLHPDQ
jgi:hypothetical protein